MTTVETTKSQASPAGDAASASQAQAAWGTDFPEAALPSAEDIQALRRLAGEMAFSRPDDLAREAARRGLLKDLAPNFHSGQDGARSARDFIDTRRIPDLLKLLESFTAAAQAMGYPPHGDSPAHQPPPELNLMNCRIEKCRLSGKEVHWALRMINCRCVGRAIFMETRFLAPVDFHVSTFQAGADFRLSSFRHSPDFFDVEFSGTVDFSWADFPSELELRNATFTPQAELNLHELHFGGTAGGGKLRLRCNQIRLGAWPRYRGRILGERSKEKDRLLVACEQYGAMEENFAAQGSPDAAAARDWCHYRYMDLRRKTQFRRWGAFRFLDWLFLKWCFGYGVSTRRILVTAVVAIGLFGLAYATNGFGLPGSAWSVNYSAADEQSLAECGPWYVRLANALYFSVITFATVGYGDWHPMHWARAAAAFEGLLGVFVMSVFTVSFARKILR